MKPKWKVVVVDDHAPSRAAVAEAVTAQGGQVLGNGSRAEDVAHLVGKHRPDAVVLAVGLPDGDGVEAARQVMAAGHCPVVMLTSHTESAVAERAIALPADVQIQVLHVVQEALSNVRKHARAHRVQLHVTQSPHWSFEIADDGCGFDPGEDRGEMHVGLSIMRERAQRIGAQVVVQSRPGAGTTVVLSLAPAAVAVVPAVEKSEAL